MTGSIEFAISFYSSGSSPRFASSIFGAIYRQMIIRSSLAL